LISREEREETLPELLGVLCQVFDYFYDCKELVSKAPTLQPQESSSKKKKKEAKKSPSSETPSLLPLDSSLIVKDLRSDPAFMSLIQVVCFGHLQKKNTLFPNGLSGRAPKRRYCLLKEKLVSPS